MRYAPILLALLVSFGCVARLTSHSPASSTEISLLPGNPGHPSHDAVLERERKRSERFERRHRSAALILASELLSKERAPESDLTIGGASYRLEPVRGGLLPRIVRYRLGIEQPAGAVDLNRLVPRGISATLRRISIAPDQQAILAVFEQERTDHSLAAVAPFLESPLDIPCRVLDAEWYDAHRIIALCRGEESAEAVLFELPGMLPVWSTPIPLWPQYQLSLRRSKDDRFVILRAAQFFSSREFLFDTQAEPQAAEVFEAVETRSDVHRAPARAGVFSLVRSEENPDSVWLETFDGASRLLYETSEPVVLEDIDAFDDFAVVFGRRGTHGFLVVLSPDGGTLAEISAPNPPAIFRKMLNPDPSAKLIRVRLTRYTEPDQILELAYPAFGIPPPETRPGGSWLRVHQLEAASHDGVLVPVTVISRDPGRMAATILTVYGAYGETLLPEYPTFFLPLLRRGCHLAVAHVRGGGFYGRAWHRQGSGPGKNRSAEDLLAAASGLSAPGIAPLGGIALVARSAGALAASTALAMEPGHFRAVYFEDAFLDPGTPQTTHASLRYSEIEEFFGPFGTAEQERSETAHPIALLQPASYPPILLRASLMDAVVPYSSSLNFADRLRTLDRGGAEIIVRLLGHGSHDGLADPAAQAYEDGFALAFLLRALNQCSVGDRSVPHEVTSGNLRDSRRSHPEHHRHFP